MDIKEFLRLTTEERQHLLKRLVYQLIPEGRVKELAYDLDKSPFTLYKWRDENHENHTLIRQELLELFYITENLALLDFMEGLLGRVAFRLPKADTSFAEINRHVAGALRECAEACQAVLGAMEEGSAGGPEITPEEFHEIDREIREAHRQLAALRHAAEKRRISAGSGAVRYVFP